MALQIFNLYSYMEDPKAKGSDTLMSTAICLDNEDAFTRLRKEGIEFSYIEIIYNDAYRCLETVINKIGDKRLICMATSVSRGSLEILRLFRKYGYNLRFSYKFIPGISMTRDREVIQFLKNYYIYERMDTSVYPKALCAVGNRF